MAQKGQGPLVSSCLPAVSADYHSDVEVISTCGPSRLHLTFHPPPRQLPPFDRQRLFMVSRPDRFCLNLEQVRETHLSAHTPIQQLKTNSQEGKGLERTQEQFTFPSILNQWDLYIVQNSMTSLTYRAAPEQRYLRNRETKGWSGGSGAPGAAKVPPQCWPARRWSSGVASEEKTAQIYREVVSADLSASLTLCPRPPLPHPTLVPSRCCLLVCHWSQSPRNQGRSLDETSGSDLPKSTRKKEMIWLLWSCGLRHRNFIPILA